MLLLIKYTLISAMVLMLVALGGMFSERSGIINIALEGIMVIGALAGLMTLNLLPAGIPGFAVVIIPVLVKKLKKHIKLILLVNKKRTKPQKKNKLPKELTRCLV